MPIHSPELRAAFDARVAELNIAPDIADRLRNDAAECYAMDAVEKDDYSRVGNTRFGGVPDLPPELPWPVEPNWDEDGPAHFIFLAQINFAELAPLHESPLPRSGMLYVFLCGLDGADSPADVDFHFYDGPLDTLKKTDRPEDTQPILDEDEYPELVPQLMVAVPALTFPHFRKGFSMYADDFPNIDDSALRRFVTARPLTYPIGQMLGFANTRQHPPDIYRELALHELGLSQCRHVSDWKSIEDYDAYVARQHEEMSGRSDVEWYLRDLEQKRPAVLELIANRYQVQPEMDRWRLLFRIDSNAEMQFNINDADPLYCFIRHSDLAAEDFGQIVGLTTQG